MVSRGVSILWIAATLVVNVFALTALLDAWEIADTAWKPELYVLGKYYVMGVNMLAQYVDGPLRGLLKIELPCWWVHGLAMYAASSSAVYAGSISRDKGVSHLKRGGLSILWPVALAGMVTQGFRNRVVTNFLRRHTYTGIFYGVAVVALWGAANWANANYIDGPPAPGQELKLQNDVRCPVVLPNPEDLLDQLGTIVS